MPVERERNLDLAWKLLLAPEVDTLLLREEGEKCEERKVERKTPLSNRKQPMRGICSLTACRLTYSLHVSGLLVPDFQIEYCQERLLPAMTKVCAEKLD
jgi:hypothetical protein